ncbi:u box domain-containing protein [Stylonychia lemnae]|uniref:Poly [ADP-ribose] polymerase n=1 Tax=Stylonychia lemnae TaxID=5949 RepID=A0A078ADD2_STYLE|nr:u box domain-containing protein [Stylonychia lemnae]|eukprot:CDW78868.1 u box domain-containing protein [Stylonychia lemnae]
MAEFIDQFRDPKLIEDTFELQQLVQTYLDYVILKNKEQSSLDVQTYGEIDDNMTLYDLIKNQPLKVKYEETLRILQIKTQLLGKRKAPEDGYKDMASILKEQIGQVEEIKEDNKYQSNQKSVQKSGQSSEEINQSKLSKDKKNQEKSEEIQRLINFYGPGVVQVKWFFNNHTAVKDFLKGTKGKALGNIIELKNDDSDEENDYYDDDYGQQDVMQNSPEEVKYKIIKGAYFQMFEEEHQKEIENCYQEYVRTKQAQETYIQKNDDIYQIKFDSSNKDKFQVINTSNQSARVITRKVKINGPLMKNKTFQWIMKPDLNQVRDYPLDNEVQSKLTEVYQNFKQSNIKTKVDVVNYLGKDHIICCEYNERGNEETSLIDHRSMLKFSLEMRVAKQSWDFIQTFKPLEDVVLQNENIVSKDILGVGSGEYEFIANYFNSTYGGAAIGQMFAGGIFPGGINPILLQPQNPLLFQPPRPAANYFSRGKGNKPRPGGQPAQQRMTNSRIIQIEKIYNRDVYDKFIQELKRMIRKYPNKKITDMVKHLFHGTKNTDPFNIYGSEDGFDIRYSNAGAYGNGIYFANNSAYSNTFTHQTQNGNCQMFVALVLIGDSVQQGPGQYRIPPNKPGSTVEKYDSINNGAGGHYIIYDNSRAYPGYLITYKQ